ncbi:hypothetical protein Agabi119p4_679 [Agaricus bisporus var. burnettii]|uniref:protein-tyrosine-phosphatase n=1 Tax=Agaricus bisporus var. burnettii TaxID=192524 RepID=A0A8H7FB56_AGABI|nr:hypothetical protein Agabi119p4_679 [Agaricus bisporus var. burnettii]
MDFFSAVADPSQPLIHNDRPLDSANDSFAEAIASRFGSGALLTTRLNPVSLAPPFRLPRSPKTTMSLAPPPLPRAPPSMPQDSPQLAIKFTTIAVSALGRWTDDPTALILDIRPHAAYSAARIPRAVSLSVPSTLLKRPLFSLSRLADMLPSANARARFSTWRSASRILVYDADSSTILESSNIYGLLRKLKNDGFQGDLAWLKGGFQVVWRESRDIIDAHPPTPDVENDDDDDEEGKSFLSSQTPNVLRTRHLPMSAFSFSSTTVSSSPSVNPTSSKRGPSSRGSTFPKLPTPSLNKSLPAYNPFFDAVRQNIELSQGITERIPLRLSRRVRHRIHDLPFPWLREIARRAAKLGPHSRSVIDSSPSASEESEDDENITSADVEEGKEALAMQFYKIELAEQRRLMGIMEYHAKETTIVTTDMNSAPDSSGFAYSITAGVEKGAKNRYRNIWPFEHARVKLHQTHEADDDYVNASYVQPMVTNKRYIATQGPLPATFTDFWTLCWEQNVHVIAMLTKEIENSMVKCGSYWTDTVYGPLRLRLVSATSSSLPAEESSPFCLSPHRHFTFTSSTRIPQQSSQSPSHHTHRNEIVRRVFELTHTSYPNVPPRRIVHLQYLDWPDMNVPDDPRGLLELVKEVNAAVKETENVHEMEFTAPIGQGNGRSIPASFVGIEESTGIAKQAMGRNRPVLLHCSAGVGRTGGFIIVDAVLDAMRREFKKQEMPDEDVMEVDEPPAAPIVLSSEPAGNRDFSSEHNPAMEAASVTIDAGSRFRIPDSDDGLIVRAPIVPTPSSDGTGPDASGSERKVSSSERASRALTYTAKTRQWAENVLCADGAAISALGTNQQPRISESESNVHLSSKMSLSTLPSDESSSSSLSQFNPFFSSGNTLANLSAGFCLPPSSSSATSISADTYTQHSPHKPVLDHGLRSRNSDSVTAATPTDCISGKSHPVHPRIYSDYGSETCPRFKGEPSGSKTQPETLASMEELASDAQKRSPSPLASLPVLSQGKSAPSSRLGPPSYNGGVSSDAEPPPSRSASPSADEGSVASQVSSYHSYLKYHHYRPIHAQSFAVNGDKADKEKPLNTSVCGVTPERPGSPANSRSAPYRFGSDPTSVVECRKPRLLHEATTPIELNSLEEPIYDIVQDMREQRMSLCQSLRQYIYVHAVILEGALMIVDEERELRRKEKQGVIRPEESEMEVEGYWKAGNSRMTVAGSGGSDCIDCSPEGSGIEQYSFHFSNMVVENKSDDDSIARPESSDEKAMDVYCSPWQNNTTRHASASAVPSPQRPRHPGGGTRFGSRDKSPIDGFRNGTGLQSLDDDSEMPRRSNGKRKQPIGEPGEVVRRKRAQNESSSRESERERERERGLERGLSNSSHSCSRDGSLDLLTSEVVG